MSEVASKPAVAPSPSALRLNVRRHATTIALVAVAVVLGCVALFERTTITTGEAEGRRGLLFDAWRADELTRLSITLGASKVELVREREASGEASWFEADGARRTAADEQGVEDVLLTLEYAGFERRVEGLDRASLGLEPPKLELAIAMGRLAYSLRVGGPAPLPPGARYVEVEGGGRPRATFVISKELAGELELDPSALRNKKLVPYLSPEVARYEISGKPCDPWQSGTEGGAVGGEEGADASACAFVLMRAGRGGRPASDLVLEAPAVRPIHASWRAVDGFVTAFGRLEAQRFVTDAPAQSAARIVRVVPRDTNKPTAELALGGECPGGAGTLVVRRGPDPVAACVDEKLVEAALAYAPARFADRHVLGVPEADVAEVSLTAGDVTVELARRELGWHLRKPEDRQLELGPGNALLERMARAEGELVPPGEVDGAFFGLDAPRAKVRIVALPGGGDASQQPRIEELVIGAERERLVYVRRESDGNVLRIPRDAASVFFPAPSALRSVTVLDVKEKLVRGLSLDCGGKRQRVTRDGKGAVTLLEPRGELGADLATTNEIVELLRTLTAVRWDAERREPRHGLDAPTCTLALEFEGPAGDGGAPADGAGEKKRRHAIVIGAETSGGYFAQREGEDAVFVAPRSLVTAASGWLLDRSALMLDAASVERVSIVSGKTELVLVRRGAVWALAAGDSADDPRAAAVGSLLENLVAEAVVGLGPADATHGLDTPRASVSASARGGKKVYELSLGAADVWRDARVVYVRKRGVDATFAVRAGLLTPLFDAL